MSEGECAEMREVDDVSESEWVGYVVWKRGRHAGFKEEITVFAPDEEVAKKRIAQELVQNYPDYQHARIVAVELGRGTLDDENAWKRIQPV
jgi:hypothetical protein